MLGVTGRSKTPNDSRETNRYDRSNGHRTKGLTVIFVSYSWAKSRQSCSTCFPISSSISIYAVANCLRSQTLHAGGNQSLLHSMNAKLHVRMIITLRIFMHLWETWQCECTHNARNMCKNIWLTPQNERWKKRDGTVFFFFKFPLKHRFK